MSQNNKTKTLIIDEFWSNKGLSNSPLLKESLSSFDFNNREHKQNIDDFLKDDVKTKVDKHK